MQSACESYDLYGQSLLRDKDIQSLLVGLDQSIEATQNAMADAGIVKECTDCATKGQGVCCGVRTGYQADAILLLINLLLGRKLPSRPADPSLCHFLTKNGCDLRARHVICINFVCPRLMDVIPHGSLCKVQETACQEIDTLFALEERIKKKISG